MAKLIGQSGSLTVFGTTYHVESWTANITNELQQVTTTGSSGWHEKIAGVSMVKGSATAFWDAAAVPTDTSGLNVRAGNSGTIACLIGNSNKGFVVPCLISDLTVENSATGAVKFSFNFESNGAVTYPS